MWNLEACQLTLATISRKVWRRLGSSVIKSIRGIPLFKLERLGSYSEYCEYLDRMKGQEAARVQAELALVPADAAKRDSFHVVGYCGVCRKWTRFAVDYAFAPRSEGALPVPNWRESLLCPGCGLNNRMRACFQTLEQLGPKPDAAIYMTEQVTSLFRRVHERYPATVGSEFLADGTKPGEVNAAGARAEDLTRLSFAADAFDFVLSFEVLEHVPDYRAALRECARVLKPAGTLLATIPFHGGPETTVRARLGPNGVEHLLPPEYHGDPLDAAGCLCFYHFGGDLLDALSEAGFRETTLAVTYSRDLGNVGTDNLMFLATK